jgi:ATP-dependent Clp protease ATP-binding subunit ClpC
MFERYTDKARRVIFFSRYEAGERGGRAIEPRHILLGLLREDKQLFTRFTNLTPLSLEALKRRIRECTGPGPAEKVSASVDMPLSVEAKRVLSYAADESDRLFQRHIGTEHLLLGLLRVEQTNAGGILQEQGLQLDTVRDALRGGTSVEAGGVNEMRILAAEARDLAAAIAKKAERIEAICDQLSDGSHDQDGDAND